MFLVTIVDKAKEILMHNNQKSRSFIREDYLSPQASELLLITNRPLTSSGPGTGSVTTDDDDEFGDDMDIEIGY